MTRCNEIREDFVAFLDDELAGVRAEAVRLHLADCPACQAECAALDGVWAALDHLPGLEPRAGWLEEVEASIVSASVVPFPLWRRGLAALAVAAALALTVGLGWLLSLPAESPAEQLVVVEPAPRLSPVDAPRVHTLPPPERPQDPQDEAPQERGPDAPGTEGVRPEQSATAEDPALALLEGLSDEELEMIEDLDVVAVLDDLDELDVLENLELLEDLDDEELPDDA